MTLNLIDKKMIVRNTIELQPIHAYVSASLNCSDLESYGITEPGVTGEIFSKVNDVKKYNLLLDSQLGDDESNIELKKSYFINSKYDEKISDQSNSYKPVTLLNEAKDLLSQGDITYTQSASESILKNNYGLIIDNTSEYKFGVETIKQKYLVDDSNFYKKKAVKNLYKYYQDNMQHRVLDPHWGFSNYNCLNFFSISSNQNLGKTHRNCLAYANPLNNTENIYDFFKKTNQLNISFYINQNNKNEINYKLNPGCVLFVEGIIGIYIVKGTSQDESGLTDGYRILIVYGDSINKGSEISSYLNQNINEELDHIDSSSNDISFYLSKDNILKYNNWHNVSISIQKSRSASNNSRILLQTDIFLDGYFSSSKEIIFNVSDSNNINNYLKPDSRNFITIGNKFQAIFNGPPAASHEDLYKKLFSVSLLQEDDFNGPYVKKNIIFSEDLNDSYFEQSVTDKNFILRDELNPETNQNYFNNTSYALNAEIHDIRIYDKVVRDVKYIICENSIKDFSDENLIFSLPVYYYENVIKKESLVNLKGIGFNNRDTQELSNLELQDLILSGPVNHVFSNKSFGHEVNIENFVYEFKKKSCPNIVFNNGISDDRNTINSLNIVAFSENNTNPLENQNSFLNNSVKSGQSVNSIYNKRLIDLSNLDSSDVNSYFFENFFSYKNNFILPCDNGLQTQHRRNLNNYYSENKNTFGHLDEKDFYSLDHISLVNCFDDNLIFMSSNLEGEITNIELSEQYSLINELVELDDRSNYYIESGISFKENYDNFKNVSINNYFRSDFKLSIDSILDNFKFKKYSSNKEDGSYHPDNRFISTSRGRFLKDLSNPVCRKINSNFDVSIASHLPSIGSKLLNTEDNRLLYYKSELPVYNLNDTKLETYSKIFCISSQVFGKKIERESVKLFDSDLGGTLGSKKIKLKDNGKGVIYRADSNTKHADWNYVGHALYKEGVITILHPSLENFGETGFKLDFKASSSLNILELNLPAYAGKTNKTYNESSIKNLRLNESAFNSDEDFVYITDINLHDKNLNIVAKAKIVKPYPKKDSDNVLFRLKMDF